MRAHRDEAIPEDYVAPCGCRFWADVIDNVKTLMLEPCDLACSNYQMALDLSRERGNSINYVDLR